MTSESYEEIMADEKIAIVTGSAKGIGRGIAKRLAADNYTIIVNYLHDAAAAQDQPLVSG